MTHIDAQSAPYPTTPTGTLTSQPIGGGLTTPPAFTLRPGEAICGSIAAGGALTIAGPGEVITVRAR